MGIPVALLNPDALPGRANRYLVRFATTVFAQWEDTVEHLPRSAHVVICGCPVRPEFSRTTRDAGLEKFGLDHQRRTLLVTGASQGARTINQVVTANLPYLESLRGWQILHLTGDRDYEAVRGAYQQRSVRAVVLPFTDHMAEALAAADLMIGRAGASSLAEITVVGRASILMPYPFHKDGHQLANARCLARASAARIVEDRVDPEINAPALRHVLAGLTADDVARDGLASNARRIGRGHAASTVAEVVLDLAEAHAAPRPRESLEPAC
jgi:UDP-N-acetylglucosamine--N-acetylmuramyl-(pentapeptide) pyrophosphoryl-undecaprenol N-acetylglucosamine transferase